MPRPFLRATWRQLIPPALNTTPREWLRAGTGALLGLLAATWLCSLGFGPNVALHVLGPLAASAVLVFAAPSAPLAQPWPVLGSYLLAAGVGVGLRLVFGAEAWVAALALGCALVGMCGLRCLHPPGGGMAVSAVLADPSLVRLGEHLFEPLLLSVLALLATAVVFNRLTGVRYPYRVTPRPDAHHTRDPLPSERLGVRAEDVEHTLANLEGYVDISRDQLEHILVATERHALQRSLDGVTAAAVMSRDVRTATPDTTLTQAWTLLKEHHLKALPVLEQGHLVGIVSLSDLVAPAMAQRRFRLRAPKTTLRQLMTRQVISVTPAHPLDRLLPLLSDHGLHCLPVLEGDVLVGVVTQTDLIAGLAHTVIGRSAA